MKELDLAAIQAAMHRMENVVHRTQLDYSTTFSRMAGCKVYLKLENLQKTGSFKIRGAYNKIVTLSDEERRHGVITASAGNHAQGVAFAANKAGIPATIVMPEVAPLAKIQATRGYGAEVVLAGGVYDEAYAKACELQQKSGATFVHAFDDSAVMAGQGTIGLEILAAMPDLSAVVVPVGGGGLIAGVATAIKEINPNIRVIGVQASGAPAVYLSKRAHARVETPEAVTMADGIAVRLPGAQTFAAIEKYVDDVVVVDEEEIAATILLLLERSKLMVEGAGAVSLAALVHGKLPLSGKVAAVLSGGNVDVNFISRIIEHGLVKAGRRVKLVTRVLDRPGELQKLIAVIAALKANVAHVYHDRTARDVPIGQASVEISLETRDMAHADLLLKTLREQGYPVDLF